MTIITRKRSLGTIVLGAFLILAGTETYAEEDAINAQPQTTKQLQQKSIQNQQAYDQQYKLPPRYMDKLYPNDDTAIGYHGTSSTAQSDSGTNGSYYYYYY